MEVWRDIKGYPDYKVSNLGRVKSFLTNTAKLRGGNIMKCGANSYGRHQVNLYDGYGSKSFLVTELVADAFTPTSFNEEVVNEEWKTIQDYEDYLVSSLGRVKSFRTNPSKLRGGDILKDSDDGNGYRTVMLHNENGAKTTKVHRLVCKAFIPNPENKEQVNHMDGNKTNNNLSNLEWMTYLENQEHSFKNGLHANPRKKVIQMTKEGLVIAEHISITEASRSTGVHRGNLSACVNGKHKTIGGYRWEFKNKNI